jgi:hypothetical protein
LGGNFLSFIDGRWFLDDSLLVLASGKLGKMTKSYEQQTTGD